MAARGDRRRSYRPAPAAGERDALAPAEPPSPASPSYPPLSPPRPFFIASRSAQDRGSYSSTDTSPDTGSDSDKEGAAAPANTAIARARNHHRRRSSMNQDLPATPTTADPFMTPRERDASAWSAAELYARGEREARDEPLVSPSRGGRAPPSAYPFPFQSHPGNPDPGMHVPGYPSRRSSTESLRMRATSSDGGHGSIISNQNFNPLSPSAAATGVAYPSANGAPGGYGQLQQNASEADLGDSLSRPYAPFMTGPPNGSPSNSRPSSIHSASGNGTAVYRNSAAAAFSSPQLAEGGGSLPRTGSVQTFRAPFLSPASRPTSSLWAPPSFPYASGGLGISSGSTTALGLAPVKGRAPLPSTRLPQKLTKEEKPWITKKEKLGRISWWLTFLMLVVGAALAAFICWRGWNSVQVLSDDELCSPWVENFESLDTDNTWTRDIELGGFGNGEFQMTTGDSANSFIKNGQLYIKPTLTSAEIGTDAIFDGTDYTLDGCTSSNQSACEVTSDKDSKTVINPVKSARMSTINSHSIKYGKVEVRAKLPRGDWLWPAIWMLPKDTSIYGAWPLSGEIDIMEARGNDASYGSQGDNFVRSTLNYGVTNSTTARLFGWQELKRTSFAADFHTYTLEWTPDFMRMSVDSKLKKMLQFGTSTKSYFDIGNFPKTAQDGANVVAITNPWKDGAKSAPFDQEFYLILDLAVGGTSGWFPDGVGGKMWIDGSSTAMHDFAAAQSTWSKQWPSNEDDLSFRIDSVKMWKLKSQGC
ncbi:concanavalin A-like lectin/glucanase, partial [Punctularia strigosozonata HHB-11173 SS5]|uniref:concanavalin A-like lectin/glucanase n=1 Tax=Punctularia strigosozonata (strain HHB-11173) TaxID=741275 RepID=UPI000441697E